MECQKKSNYDWLNECLGCVYKPDVWQWQQHKNYCKQFTIKRLKNEPKKSKAKLASPIHHQFSFYEHKNKIISCCNKHETRAQQFHSTPMPTQSMQGLWNAITHKHNFNIIRQRVLHNSFFLQWKMAVDGITQSVIMNLHKLQAGGIS